MFWSSKRPGSRRIRHSATFRSKALSYRPAMQRLEDRTTPASLSVGPVENVSRLPGNQSEAAIAINPTNPSNIIAASNTFAGSGVEVYRTTDAGASWTSQLVGAG